MKAIAFHLQKGGVGKTSLSVSVAWELAAQGKPTVVIDCDPQGNASSWLLEGVADPVHELADVLTGKAPAESAAVEVSENLYCVPTFGLSSALADYGKTGLASEPFVIADLVESLPFEYAVLDMGPGLGNIETAALVATGEVILTMTPEYFALDGLETWAARVEKIGKGLRVKIHYNKLVVNGLNLTVGQMREVYESALKAARHVFTVGTDPVFRKAQAAHVAAQAYAGEPMKESNRLELARLAKAVM